MSPPHFSTILEKIYKYLKKNTINETGIITYRDAFGAESKKSLRGLPNKKVSKFYERNPLKSRI